MYSAAEDWVGMLGVRVVMSPLDGSSFWLSLTNTIVLTDEDDLWHEIGHVVLDRLRAIKSLEIVFEAFGNVNANYYFRKEYFSYDDCDYTDNPDFVSRYAQSHPMEDFAETFAYVAERGFKKIKVKSEVKQKKIDTILRIVEEYEF